MLGSINSLQHALSTTHPDSKTATSTQSTHDVPQTAPAQAPPGPRPPHLRSHSYLSPVDPRPRYALTMPAELGSVSSKREKEKEEDEPSNSSLLPRIHLPGHRSRHAGSQEEKSGHGHGHRHGHRHRHTRSEVPGNSRMGTGTGSGDGTYDGAAANAGENSDRLLHPGVAGVKNSMLTRMATNLSSHNPHTHPHAQLKLRHQYSTSDFHNGWNAAAAAVAGGSGGRPDVRRRATSDPKAPAQRSQNGYGYGRDGPNAQFIGYGGGGGALNTYGQYPGLPAQPERKPMTEIEVLLYKAEKAKREADANVTEADVQRLTTQLAESNVELQEQLAGSNRTASDLMRRLDDAHHSLLSTASSLIDTISSFQNLVTQSRTLIENFEHRSKELDRSTRKTLEKRRKALFDQKGEQVQKLEERGQKANEKAEELSGRLENCRTIVRNFQEREQTKRRAWKGVLVGSLWGVALIVCGLLLGFGLWWYRNYGDVVRYDVHEAVAMASDRKGLGHLQADEGGGLKGILTGKKSVEVNETERVKMLENVPEDVRIVLQDIASRHDSIKHPESAAEESETQRYTRPSSEARVEDDKKLRKLFEKLEL